MDKKARITFLIIALLVFITVISIVHGYRQQQNEIREVEDIKVEKVDGHWNLVYIYSDKEDRILKNVEAFATIAKEKE